MSDINKPLVAFDIHGAIEQLVAKDNKIEQLEAENARLKGKVAQLEEAYDVKNRVHEKLNKDYLQLKAELAARDWQSAKPASDDYFEGEYAIKFKQDGHNREMFGHHLLLNYLFLDEEETGIKKDIKYFKLPDVEEE
jgi:predicted nuclease with TOPRIM domain